MTAKSNRVTIEFVRDLERRIASLEQRVENLATLVEGPPPWDEAELDIEIYRAIRDARGDTDAGGKP